MEKRTFILNKTGSDLMLFMEAIASNNITYIKVLDGSDYFSISIVCSKELYVGFLRYIKDNQ